MLAIDLLPEVDQDPTAQLFANAWQEVLIWGYIPQGAVLATFSYYDLQHTPSFYKDRDGGVYPGWYNHRRWYFKDACTSFAKAAEVKLRTGYLLPDVVAQGEEWCQLAGVQADDALVDRVIAELYRWALRLWVYHYGAGRTTVRTWVEEYGELLVGYIRDYRAKLARGDSDVLRRRLSGGGLSIEFSMYSMFNACCTDSII
ncbi:hypothetical protein JAAARDRAFT_194773 [Jaapia argillacea MUCL 33604]|uniref:Uncharacterized protein n=1 Tax=Jaapia argillacea MUCL 33604 TaxID=933084 RepID=A0A067Q2K3_9AGAM|nr:hypothetical protein JAAARDRAFT_194773 [Jaapia argillacea MUCL 33604]